MLRRRIKDAIRGIVIGGIWLFLLWVGFLARDYQDDFLLAAYIIAGATGVAGVIGWFLMEMDDRRG